MTRVIAVTGATGVLGARVADRVLAGAAAADATVRLVVRNAPRAPRLPGAAITEFPGGYAEGEGFRDALAGVHTLYLVSAAEAEDRLQQHVRAVEAADTVGVQRIVYTSFLNAAPDAVFTLVRQHVATEQAIAATGLRWTALRHSMYADFVPFFAVRQDGRAVIAAPAGDGRASFVSRDDLADVAVEVLRDDSDRFDGQALEVSGPEALSLAEAAAVLT